MGLFIRSAACRRQDGCWLPLQQQIQCCASGFVQSLSQQGSDGGDSWPGKEIAVKKYVVRPDAEERDRLGELIRKGKRSAQLLTKARILLKADVSDGEGWSDSRIAAALDTSIATVERTRRQLVEEGFEAVLARKYNSNSARPRIFDGVAEAKLIALTLSPAPEGFARWSLRLLEEKVVELNIVVKTSDNTIGRTLKKTFSNRTSSSNG